MAKTATLGVMQQTQYASALDQNVQDISVLVDRAPKIVLLAADPDEHLVHGPLVSGLWPAPLQRIDEDPAEAQESGNRDTGSVTSSCPACDGPAKAANLTVPPRIRRDSVVVGHS